MTRVHSDSRTPSHTGAQATVFPFKALSNCARNSSRASAAFEGVVAITVRTPIEAIAPHQRCFFNLDALFIASSMLRPFLALVDLKVFQAALVPLFRCLLVAWMQVGVEYDRDQQNDPLDGILSLHIHVHDGHAVEQHPDKQRTDH